MSLNDEEREAVVADDIAPDTGLPMPTGHKIRFAAGMIVFNILWMTAGTAASQVLLPSRFTTLDIGQPETVLATMNSMSIIFALVANVVFGALSDSTRSRFGKRTPWIPLGGVVAGIAYYMTSVATSLVGIVAWWSVLQIGVNIMIAPCVAILSDRVPARIRGTLSAFYGVGQILGQSLGALIGAQFVTNERVGFVIGTVIWLLTGFITIVIIPREKSSLGEGGERFSLRKVVMQFRPPTRNARDFYLALVGRMCLIFGYNMIMAYQLYVCMNHIGLDNEGAAGVVAEMATITMVVSLVTSLASGPISDRLGRRKPPIAVASVVIAAGFAVPWLVPTSTSMLVMAGVVGLGYGIYMAVDQALNVDVLPDPDEAGKDLGILNLANTLGQVVAPIITSSLVIATGSYAALFPVAIAAVLVGAVVIMFIRNTR